MEKVVGFLLIAAAFSVVIGLEEEPTHIDHFQDPTVGEKALKNLENAILIKNITLFKITTLSWTYDMKESNGFTLKSGEKVLFETPEIFRSTNEIDSVILSHRKPKENSLAMDSISNIKNEITEETYDWDFQPAYIRVSCYDAGKEKWTPWVGPHGYTMFAEPRSYRNPVLDNRRYSEPRDNKNPLQDLLSDFSLFMGIQKCDCVLVENVSPENHKSSISAIHSIVVRYRPFRGKINKQLDDTKICTDGSKFADPEWKHLFPVYGGGYENTVDEVKGNGAIYPGAAVIDIDSEDYKKITPWLVVRRGGLIIRLRPSQLWAGCELMIGNRILSNPKNPEVDKDGIVGSKGNSELTAFLRHRIQANGTLNYLVRNYNVKDVEVLRLDPPNMWDIGIPKKNEPEIEFSSSIIRVDVKGDPVHIMGARCRYYRETTVVGGVPLMPYNITNITQPYPSSSFLEVASETVPLEPLYPH